MRSYDGSVTFKRDADESVYGACYDENWTEIHHLAQKFTWKDNNKYLYNNGRRKQPRRNREYEKPFKETWCTLLISAIFTQGLTFVTSGSLSCTPNPFYKAVYSKRKDFAIKRNKVFPFRIVCFYRKETSFDRIDSWKYFHPFKSCCASAESQNLQGSSFIL